ncbi:transposase [Flavobacterium psychrophilum]
MLNFFKNRHTNANAESFNSKIKLFRANQRGVVETLSRKVCKLKS